MKIIAKLMCIGLLISMPVKITAWGIIAERPNQETLISYAKWILAVQVGNWIYQGYNRHMENSYDKTLLADFIENVPAELGELLAAQSLDKGLDTFFENCKKVRKGQGNVLESRKNLQSLFASLNDTNNEFFTPDNKAKFGLNIMGPQLYALFLKCNLEKGAFERRLTEGQPWAFGAGIASCLLTRLLLSFTD